MGESFSPSWLVHKNFGSKVIAFNYAIRSITILVGFFLLSGRLFYDHPNKTELQIIGGLLVIWGFYRIYSYRRALKRLNEEKLNENE
ncbi:MAG: hypothetical protein ACUVQ1_01620 [Candidatus Kapaibacteriales bacterium]